jgi:hypothetical protein
MPIFTLGLVMQEIEFSEQNNKKKNKYRYFENKYMEKGTKLWSLSSVFQKNKINTDKTTDCYKKYKKKFAVN